MCDVPGPEPSVGIVPAPQRGFLEAVDHVLTQQHQRTNVSSAATLRARGVFDDASTATIRPGDDRQNEMIF